MSYVKTLEDFLASDAFPAAVASATRASWGGSGYTLEMFSEGDWRVLWDGQIGNLYVSPGILLRIPPLAEDAYEGEGGDDLEDAAALYADAVCGIDDEMREQLNVLLEAFPLFGQDAEAEPPGPPIPA